MKLKTAAILIMGGGLLVGACAFADPATIDIQSGDTDITTIDIQSDGTTTVEESNGTDAAEFDSQTDEHRPEHREDWRVSHPRDER